MQSLLRCNPCSDIPPAGKPNKTVVDNRLPAPSRNAPLDHDSESDSRVRNITTEIHDTDCVANEADLSPTKRHWPHGTPWRRMPVARSWIRMPPMIHSWQAALAASKGFEVTSFDADFRSFPLPHFEHLKP
jgi:hypothetical protein